MGCSCGSSTKYIRTYIYTSPNGEQKSYNTEVEAKAAWLRNGKEGAITFEDKPR